MLLASCTPSGHCCNPGSRTWYRIRFFPSLSSPEMIRQNTQDACEGDTRETGLIALLRSHSCSSVTRCIANPYTISCASAPVHPSSHLRQTCLRLICSRTSRRAACAAAGTGAHESGSVLHVVVGPHAIAVPPSAGNQTPHSCMARAVGHGRGACAPASPESGTPAERAPTGRVTGFSGRSQRQQPTPSSEGRFLQVPRSPGDLGSGRRRQLLDG